MKNNKFRKISIKSEKKSAKKYGMRTRKNSGAGYLKGDLYSDMFLIEQKDVMDNLNRRISAKELRKHISDAQTYNLIPAFLLKFRSMGVEMFILPGHLFDGMMTYWEKSGVIPLTKNFADKEGHKSIPVSTKTYFEKVSDHSYLSYKMYDNEEWYLISPTHFRLLEEHLRATSNPC